MVRLSPNPTLIFAPEAARMLGISLRELEYWKAFQIGPDPFIIYRMDGGRQSMFLASEIEELTQRPKEIQRFRALFKEKAMILGFSKYSKDKPKYD